MRKLVYIETNTECDHTLCLRRLTSNKISTNSTARTIYHRHKQIITLLISQFRATVFSACDLASLTPVMMDHRLVMDHRLMMDHRHDHLRAPGGERHLDT